MAVRLALTALAAFAAAPAAAFPIFLEANGTTTVKSAFGADLKLDPDAGGAPSRTY
jgi:hypothetical protein